MRRLLNPELALGFLVATVLWIGVLGWQASHTPTDSEKRQCEEAATKSGHKTEECKSLWERTTTDPVAFFTFWLVVFTGVLGASTIMLWRAGERQIELTRVSSATQSRDMQESMRISKRAADAAMTSAEVSKAAIRAVVTLSNYTGGRGLNPDGTVDGYFMVPNIRNVGSTHALNCKFIVSVRMLRIDDTEFRFSRDGSESPIVAIGPGAVLSSSEKVGVVLSDAMKVWRNEAKCLLWCRVDYEDTLGEPHHVEQCVRVLFRDDPSFTGDILKPEEFISYASDGPQNSAN